MEKCTHERTLNGKHTNQEKYKHGIEESKQHRNVMNKVFYQLRFLIIT